MRGTAPDARALAALAAISFTWGVNWPLLKAALPWIGPFEFGVFRYGAAVLLLFAIIAATGRPFGVPKVWQVLGIGALQTAASFALVLFALRTGAAGKSSVLCYTMPFWVALLAWPMLGERPSPRQWLAIGIACTGLVLLLQPGTQTGRAWAELLALGAGAVWALGIVLTKRMQSAGPPIDPMVLSAWQSAGGTLAMVALALASPGGETQWNGLLIFALLYNALLVAGIAWWLWVWVLGRLDAGLASLGILAVPVFGVLSGILFLGERPNALEWAGMGLIVIALGLVSLIAARGGR